MLAALCVGLASGKHCFAFHDKDGDFTAIARSLESAVENQKQQAAKLAELEKTANIGAQNQLILSDLQGSVKKALEDLEKTRKDHYTLEERMNALKKANMTLELERRASFGSPQDVIVRNPEKAARFVASVCKMLDIPVGGQVAKTLADYDVKLLGNESSPGSNYITPELMNDIYNTLLTYGAYKRFKVIRTNTRDSLLPLTTARPVASWVTTEGTGPSADTTKAGSRGTLAMGEILCHVPVSLRLIEDGGIDIVADLVNDMGEAFGYILDNTLFNAETTSNATYGGYNGIINQAGVVTAAAGTTVAATGLADWLGTVAALDSGVLQRGVQEWFIHPAIAIQAMGVVDSAGRPIFQTALDAVNAKSIMNILGFPVNQVGVMPSTNSAAQKIAVIGDPNGAVVGISRAMDIQSSEHAGWTDATRNFRLRGRAGILVRKAGAFKALKTHA